MPSNALLICSAVTLEAWNRAPCSCLMCPNSPKVSDYWNRPDFRRAGPRQQWPAAFATWMRRGGGTPGHGGRGYTGTALHICRASNTLRLTFTKFGQLLVRTHVLLWECGLLERREPHLGVI